MADTSERPASARTSGLVARFVNLVPQPKIVVFLQSKRLMNLFAIDSPVQEDTVPEPQRTLRRPSRHVCMCTSEQHATEWGRAHRPIAGQIWTCVLAFYALRHNAHSSRTCHAMPCHAMPCHARHGACCDQSAQARPGLASHAILCVACVQARVWGARVW